MVVVWQFNTSVDFGSFEFANGYIHGLFSFHKKHIILLLRVYMPKTVGILVYTLITILFSYLYREETPLVNMFTFDLLKHFVESLALAHRDEKSLGNYPFLPWKYLSFIVSVLYNNFFTLFKNTVSWKNWL